MPEQENKNWPTRDSILEKMLWEKIVSTWKNNDSTVDAGKPCQRFLPENRQSAVILQCIGRIISKGMAVQKKRAAQGGGVNYPYAKIEDYELLLYPLINEEGLILSPYYVSSGKVIVERAGDRGNLVCLRANVRFNLTHVESGEWMEWAYSGDAQFIDDKALPKAMTAARKAFLRGVFNVISSEDDPDAVASNFDGYERDSDELEGEVARKAFPKIKADAGNAEKLLKHRDRVLEVYNQKAFSRADTVKILAYIDGELALDDLARAEIQQPAKGQKETK